MTKYFSENPANLSGLCSKGVTILNAVYSGSISLKAATETVKALNAVNRTVRTELQGRLLNHRAGDPGDKSAGDPAAA